MTIRHIVPMEYKPTGYSVHAHPFAVVFPRAVVLARIIMRPHRRPVPSWKRAVFSLKIGDQEQLLIPRVSWMAFGGYVPSYDPIGRVQPGEPVRMVTSGRAWTVFAVVEVAE